MSYEAKQIEKDIVSKNLRTLLKRNHKKQIDLVRDLGLSQSIVSEYLNAKKYPAPDKMQLLADYFNVMKSDIMQEKPAPNKEDGSDEETKMLIKIYHELSQDDRELLVQQAKLLIDRRKK